MWTTREPGFIVVGVDDTAGALAAARFAVEEGRLRGLDVQLQHGFQLPVRHRTASADLVPRLREQGQQILDATVAQLDIPSSVRVETVVRQGSPSILLSDAAAVAEMVVVGQHPLGSGDHAAELPGPVSHLAARSACPVVTVPAGDVGATDRPVVVALDGETLDGETVGEVALAFALEEAELRQTELVVLHVIDGVASGVEATRARIADLVAGRTHHLPPARIRTLVVPGESDQVMILASRNAALLVVGHPQSDHLGAWTSSVGRAVLRRCACPVAVVPEQRRFSGNPVREPDDERSMGSLLL